MTIYMNPFSGAIGTYDEWCYELEDGSTVNAVDRNEVVEVKLDDEGNLLPA